MSEIAEKVELKERFTVEEIEAMKRPQREAWRFVVEGEDKKAFTNVYRITPEEGIRYCNKACDEIYEKKGYTGILKLRVMSRISNTEWKEVGYIQRDKDRFFDENVFGYQS